MLKDKSMQIAFAGAIALGYSILMNVLALLTADVSSFNLILQGIGGTTTGFIQFACVWLFTYTTIELRERKLELVREQLAFDDKIIPETEHLVLTPDEVAEIKRNIIRREKSDGQNYILRNMAKQVCNQYRNNRSVVEAYQLLEYQVKSKKQLLESKLEFTRYTLRAIEMLGLVGTVIGLTYAISQSGGMLQPNPVARETALLGIVSHFSMAFGTTLVAICLGLFLARQYHAYIANLDAFMANTERFIIDNLISRIYEPESVSY